MWDIVWSIIMFALGMCAGGAAVLAFLSRQHAGETDIDASIT